MAISGFKRKVKSVQKEPPKTDGMAPFREENAKNLALIRDVRREIEGVNAGIASDSREMDSYLAKLRKEGSGR